MKLLKYIFTLLFITLSDAETINLSTESVEIRNFSIEYCSSRDISLQEAKEKSFLKGSNSLALSHNNRDIWICFSIKNSTTKVKKLNLHHTYGYLSLYTNFYLLDRDRVIKEKPYRLKDAKDREQMFATDSIFEFELPPKREQNSLYK